MDKQLFAQENLDSIRYVDGYPDFSTGGLNDPDGFQIFTPEFIVKDMLKLIGKDNINDIYKTVLEPASGDGAFTVRILESRLTKIKHDEHYLQKSLIALSTIFSIEMDEDLIKKQRNNIYSLIVNSAKNSTEEITEDYLLLTKKIILSNFIWGETNIDKPLKYKGEAMGWYMPTIIKNKSKKTDKNRIQFANWKITQSIHDSSFDFEDWETSISETDYSDLGGLFGE
ncbi:MAG: hypothetical protein JXR48_10600 [Candidatus Delongbacteria bacterium]|nr:hypothetical protein [Candidatus Delongbacteria bacterium]